MSILFLWIGIPVFMGIILALLNRWPRFVFVAGTLVSAGLSVGARLIPFDSLLVLGPWSIQFSDNINIFGLNFLLTDADRSILILLFSLTTFLMAGSAAARIQRRLVPYGLIVIAFIIAALSVEPLFFGALFLPLAVLFSVLILLQPGVKINQGVMRFLIFQIIGMVFILLTGWLFSSGKNLIEDPLALSRAIFFLGIGFAFALAVFPFSTWVIMVSENSHPYGSVYVFSMVFGAYTLYFLSFLGEYQWVLSAVDILKAIRIAGVIMVATGGAFAAFQRNLGRLLGYAVVIEVGRSLLSISLLNGNIHNAMLVPRILSLSVWGLGLSVLREHSENLNFRTVQGMARQFPWAGAAVILAHLSIAGLPLLAGLPVILVLWKELVTVSLSSAVWSFLGNFGLVVAGFRSLAVLVMGPKVLPWENNEGLFQKVYLLIGIVALFFLGIFPHWVYPWFSELSSAIWVINP